MMHMVWEDMMIKVQQQVSLLEGLLHHRVRNNLQVIISLLSTQMDYLTDENARKALQKMRLRVFALSLVDNALLDSAAHRDIDFGVYIEGIVRLLSEEYGTEGRIVYRVESVALCIDAEAARLLGLMLQEVLSNAIEHAFPHGGGRVLVRLEDMGQGGLRLPIEDNGVGMPRGSDMEGFTSFGMNLIKGLSEQLGGALEISGEGGVRVRLDLRQGSSAGSRQGSKR